MKKKLLSLTVLLAMLLQMVIPVNLAVAVDNEVPSDQINVTKSKLTITDSSDNVINPTKDAGDNWVYSDIPKDAKIDIEYAFSLKDNNGLDSSDPSYIEYEYTSEQAISVEMPKGVDFSSTVPVSGQTVLAADSTPMGTLKLSGSTAVISFAGYNYVETHSSMGGAFHISGSFDSSVKSNPSPDPITFVFNGTTYKINVIKDAPPPPPPSFKVNMSKSGEYDSATDTIIWTVKLKPVEGDGKNISVEDVYSDNQQYINNSFKVDGSGVSSGLVNDASSHKLTYTFSGDIPENTEKVITYNTIPTSNAFDSENGTYETVDFTNAATVKSGTTDKGTASAKIQLNWIHKEGVFDPDTFVIHWKVDINNDASLTDSDGNTTLAGQSVVNPVITDVLPAGLELVANSVKFNNADILADSSISPGTYNYNSATRTLIYSHNGTVTGKKTLTFDAKVVNPDADLNKNEKTNYSNTAKLEWTGNIGGTPSCKADVGVGKSVIAKSGTGKLDFVANGTDDVITWTVTVNENMITMVNPTVTDALPEGLEYVPGSFRLDDYREDDPEFFGTLTAAPTSINYSFGKDINDTHVIRFKTKVKDYSKFFANSSSVAYTNTAKVISTSVIGGEQSANATKSFTSEVINKSVATAYDYATRRIKWKIVVDKNKIPMTGAVISDTMPEGMKFVSETFDVVNESNAHVTSSVGMLEYVNAGDDETALKDSFKYTFSGTNDTKRYTITYETEMKEKYLKENQFAAPKNFVNTANISDSNYAKTVSSSANQSVKNPIIEKKSSYVKGADTIDWIVPINIAKTSWSDGIEISDQLQQELELDTDSVKLYHMVLNSNGTLTKSAVVPVTDYDVLYKGKKLTLSIHGPVTGAYQLEFTTDVLVEQANISNSVTFKGAAITTGSTSSSVSVDINDVTSIFYGKQGSITISKVDEADNNIKLSGAVFQLYDINKVPIIGKLGTTDSNGKLVLDYLKLKTYYIGEVSAPDGYLPDKTLQRVKIDPITLNFSAVFSDKKGAADIEFQKQTSAGNPLAGAEFTLYSKGSSVPLKTAVSDNTGKVVFTGFAAGNYEIKESKAPDGYKISTDIIQAKVEIVGGVSKVTLSESVVKNSSVLADIEFQKQTLDGNPLAGAEFTLYAKGSIVPLKTSVSDNNGKVVYTGIAAGDYEIKESKAPDGYNSSSDIIQAKVEVVSGAGKVTLSKNVIKNSPVVGNIEFQKQTSAGNPLAGAEFTLYSKGSSVPLKTAVSDTTGKVIFTGIAAGDYEIKESKAPDGYNISTDTIQAKVEVVSGAGKVTLSKNVIKNSQVVGNIEFQKQTSAGNPLAGAEFTLYSKGSSVPLKTAVSDNTGKVIFTGIAAGDYEIKESKAPDGYNISTDTIQAKVEIVSGAAKATLSNSVVKNSPKDNPPPTPKEPMPPAPGKIIVTKTDEQGKPLEGAAITLYKADGTSISSGKTDIFGKLSFDGLYSGSYTVKETAAPAGYELNNNAYQVTILGDLQTVNIVNNKVKEEPGTVTVIKKDDSGALLAGAGFTLADSKGTIVATGITDKSGNLVFSNLPAGEYTITEIKAPEGYTPDNTAVKVTLESGKGKEVSFTNKKIDKPVNSEEKGSVIIRKTDGGSKQLSGAEFSLVDADGKEITSGITDKNGVLVFKDIPVGSYTIIETKAPVGYEPGKASVKVSIEDKKTKEISIANIKQGIEKQEGGTVIINKIDGKSKPLSGAEFTLLDMKGNVLAKYVSDAQGRVIFEKLKEGEYQLQETKAPEGYSLVSKKLTIKIEKNKLLKLTFRDIRIEEVEDNKIPLGWIDINPGPNPPNPNPVIKIPQAGEWADTAVMLASGSGLVIIGGICLAVRRRRKKAD